MAREQRGLSSLKSFPKGQTGVMDRGYQCHERFDQWQQDGQLFVCRIKASTIKKILSRNPVPADSIVFFDAMVLLGTAGVNQSQTPLRLVGYEIDRVKYWIATNRYDLSQRNRSPRSTSCAGTSRTFLPGGKGT